MLHGIESRNPRCICLQSCCIIELLLLALPLLSDASMSVTLSLIAQDQARGASCENFKAEQREGGEMKGRKGRRGGEGEGEMLKICHSNPGDALCVFFHAVSELPRGGEMHLDMTISRWLGPELCPLPVGMTEE